MSDHLPALIVVLPLSAAVLTPVAALIAPGLARGLTLSVLVSTCFISWGALVRVLREGVWHYHLGGWAPPWGIELVIDPLSGAMAVLVSSIAVLVAFYAAPPLRDWPGVRRGVWYALFLLLVAGLLGMVVTGDMFNLYVFLEIASLAAYALLASSGGRAFVASFRYLLVGTIAASFYLLGIGYLYALTGTLNMADLAARLPAVVDSPVVTVAVSLIVVGLAIKSALFPLHGWLPDAYTYAPGPAVGFIAAVMAKVSAYALFRVLYFVFGTRGAAGEALILLGWASALAVVAGSMMAVAQKDIRRMLAYSSVGQMGYIMLGFAIGGPTAITGALLHVLNHAVMKGCLFLIAGGVLWRTGVYRIQDFVGMSRRMPVTMAAFSLAAFSMIGLPPTAGFFSKYYLALGAIETGRWPFLAALVLSSLLSAVYFFRVIERSYLLRSKAGEPASSTPVRPQELPGLMLVPIVVLAGGVLLLGVLNQTVVMRVIQFALPTAGT
ncbi:MAG: proton-conducting transporter membrane subunit [Acidobacteriota bacterium]